MDRVLNPEGAVVISIHEKYTDYSLNVRRWDRGYTGHLCCWLGCYLTDVDVILCGMDLYSDKKHYFGKDAGSTGGNRTWDIYERQWSLAWGKDPKDKGCPNPERISAVSGPLTKIFKKYETIQTKQTTAKTDRNCNCYNEGRSKRR